MIDFWQHCHRNIIRYTTQLVNQQRWGSKWPLCNSSEMTIWYIYKRWVSCMFETELHNYVYFSFYYGQVFDILTLITWFGQKKKWGIKSGYLKTSFRQNLDITQNLSAQMKENSNLSLDFFLSRNPSLNSQALVFPMRPFFRKWSKIETDDNELYRKA